MERIVTLIVPEDGAVEQPNDLTFRWNISVEPVLTLNVVNKTAKSITIGWQSDPYAEGHKIYKDGVLAEKLLNTTAKYTFSDLTAFTTYTFGVSSVDFLGQESDIVTVTSKTLAEDAPSFGDKMPESMSLVSVPTKTNYLTGESLDLTGLVVELEFIDEDPQQLPVDYLTISGFDSNVEGLQTVVLSYYQFALFSVNFDVTVGSASVTGIEIVSEPSKKIYQIDDELDLSGLVVVATYDDLSTAEINHSNLTITGFDSSLVEDAQEISVSYASLPPLTFSVDIIDSLPSVDDYFVFDADTKTITGYDAVAGGVEVIIPASFNVEGVDVSVENIGSHAFVAKGLTRVVLPDGLLSIGDNAFAGNSLTKITIPDSVASIEMAAFYNNKLKDLVLPNSVQNVGLMAFNRNQLQSVVLSEQMTEISEQAFSDNVVTKIILPNQMSHVGVLAFRNSLITEVKIGDNVTFGAAPVGLSMVEGENCLGIYSERFVNAYVLNGRSAGEYLYDKSTNTWSRNDVLSISLVSAPSKVIYQMGEALDLDGLSVEASYNDSTSALLANEDLIISGFDSSSANPAQTIIISYAGYELNFDVVIEERPVTTESFFVFDSVTNTITGYDIAGGLDVVIPEFIDVEGVAVVVEKIGVNAFKELGITSVVFPNSLIRIDAEAFYGNSLTTLSFPSNISFIGAGAFENNQIAGLLVVPNSVIDLGQRAFANNKISELTLGNQMGNMIADYAFFGNALASIVVPSQIQYVGESAFGDSPIVRIVISAGVGFGVYNNSFGLNTDLFIAVYGTGTLGGTYVFENGAWLLQ